MLLKKFLRQEKNVHIIILSEKYKIVLLYCSNSFVNIFKTPVNSMLNPLFFYNTQSLLPCSFFYDFLVASFLLTKFIYISKK